MNKAIQLLTSWIDEHKAYLKILIDRMASQKHWSEVKEKSAYYTPKYHETKKQVDVLEREIVECEQALKLLSNPSSDSVIPASAGADKG